MKKPMQRRRAGATLLEVLISSGMMVPVIAVGMALLVMGARALSTGAVRSGAVRGVVALREEISRDLAAQVPGRAPVVTGRTLSLTVRYIDGNRIVQYEGQDDGSVLKREAGRPPVRVGRLMRGVFSPRDDGDGRVTVNLQPRDDTNEHDAGVRAYEESFGGASASRYAPIYRSVLDV